MKTAIQIAKIRAVVLYIMQSFTPVSYTHLDVYKRQAFHFVPHGGKTFYYGFIVVSNFMTEGNIGTFFHKAHGLSLIHI